MLNGSMEISMMVLTKWKITLHVKNLLEKGTRKIGQCYKKKLSKKKKTVKVCEVSIDSFGGVIVHRYFFLPLNFYMAFYEVPGILSDASAGILYHHYLLIFTNSFNVFFLVPQKI